MFPESVKTIFKKPSQIPLQIIPLGGLDGIGKNMQVIRYGDDILVIDAGMMFPDETLPGIDKVIANMTYIRENKDKVRAVILTHGHEDHIGALSFLYDEINAPLYATKLTMGLAESKLRGNQKKQVKKHIVTPRQRVTIGAFEVEFIQVNHSIPDGVGLAIRTPVGMMVHSGDFKIDHTPIDGKMIDLNRFAELGDEGVMVFLSDSTNADEPGFTLSEKVVGETFEREIQQAEGRIIIAMFASNIHRIQSAIDASLKYGRKFAVLGKSIEESVEISRKIGYLHYPEEAKLNFEQMQKAAPNTITILTTGSQGEPMSALNKMARNEYKHLKISPQDTIVISAIPIPGNEKAVGRNVDCLFRLGANVVYEAESDVHVSGHAKQEELKMLLHLVKPNYFIPVHGEYRHLKYHARLAESMGIPSDHIFLAENGDVMEFTPHRARKAGKVKGGSVLVDGLGRVEDQDTVLQERRMLANEGVVSLTMVMSSRENRVLTTPLVKTKGCVYVKESQELIAKLETATRQRLTQQIEKGITENKQLRKDLQQFTRDFLYDQTHRNPIVLVAIIDIASTDNKKNEGAE